jgi:hypothetical protein
MSVADHQSVAAGFINGQVIHPVGHTVATGAVILSVLGWLTPVLTAVATLMAILWYAVTLYESKTVQDILARWKSNKIIGVKATAQSTAAVDLTVAKQAVKDANALPTDPVK